jgi:mannose-6-phosphate isomerase-like protein (cupin superfamily)
MHASEMGIGHSLLRPEFAIFGTGYRMLIDSTMTNGAYELMYFMVPVGTGPPTHIHQHEDECYFITGGQFEVKIGNRSFSVSEGDYVHLPRKIPHCIRNSSKEMSSFLCWVTPGNLGGFFEAIKQPWAKDEKYPGMLNNQGIEQLMNLAAKYDVELLPD